jgi:zinc/manganese transport system substrate-binding protein
MKLLVLIFSLFIFSWLSPGFAHKKIEVLTSFSILADFVKVVGKEHVHVRSIVPCDSDPHVYQPTPDVAIFLSHADLVVINGLGFEGWISRLLEASHYKGVVLVATQGIVPRVLLNPAFPQSPPVPDPHAWHNVKHAIIYIQNIRDALIKVDPVHQEDYRKQAQEYVEELSKLDRWIQINFTKIPLNKRKIISAHDAFGYFAECYGLKIYALQGISTESEPSAKEIAQTINLINKDKIRALFAENITSHHLIEQIALETNIMIGGILYSDGLSKPQGPADNYLKLMRHNVTTLLNVLKKE